jgi:transcriptional regulator with XRE-family HTH domain
MTDLPTLSTPVKRLRWLRAFKKLSVQEFARRADCDPGYISKLEHDKSTNPSRRFLTRVAVNFWVNSDWLKTGKGVPFLDPTKDALTQKALPAWSKEKFQRIVAVLDELPDALAAEAVIGHLQAIWTEVGNLPNLPATARLFWNMVFMHCQIPKTALNLQNRRLTDTASANKREAVKAQLPNLLERLKKATAEPGAKSALAEFLDVPLASLSRWLSGEREPGGETTLRLLQWVEAAEGK